ncbi:MAG: sigma-70 family RNA polymerase sigma factor [Planctomycetia bacterium]|nr:sigma-70 family RNA polymerase sigma factor [Planctomycetia bacterium]
MSTEARDDIALLAEFVATGQESPFAEIVRRHQGLVFGVCLRVLSQFQDAEDAAQAVFLTLAHKASGLRERSSLAGWLHRTAWHVALRAREAVAVRKNHEREAAAMSDLSDNPDYSWADLKPILDFEIDALPEKYRLPLILHYMQGQTKEETARQLGLKSGTVSTWLDRGRELLRERLSRRGLAVSSALLATLLLDNSTATAWSPMAASAVVQAAVQVAAGDAAAAAGAVSPQVIALTQGTVRLMAVAQMKFVATVAAAVVLTCTSVGVVTYQTLKSPPPVVSAALVVAPPAALDQLAASAIPELEVFNGQPPELVAVLGEHRGRHAGPVQSLAVSADGQLAVTGGSNGQIRFWDAATLRLKHTLSAGGAVLALAISRDGQRLAVGTHSGAVSVWALDGQRPPQRLLAFDISNTPVHALCFHPLDAKRLAVGGGDGSVQVWDVSTKDAENLASHFLHKGPIGSVVYAADGKTLATGSADRTIRLWDATTAELREKALLTGHTASVRTLAFAPGNGWLASGSEDGTVKLWFPTGTPSTAARTFSAQAGRVQALAYHPDGKTLAVAGSEKRICLWQTPHSSTKLEQPHLEGKLEGHAGEVLALTFRGSDGKQLLTGSADGTARLWHWQDAAHAAPIGHLGAVTTAAFSTDGRQLATLGRDATVRLWSLDGTSPNERLVLRDQADVTALTFSPDGQTLVAAGATGQGTVKQWDTADGRVLRQFSPQLKGLGQTLALAPGGQQVLFGCRDRTLRLWDVAEAKETAALTGHEANITALVIAADGKRALSGAGQPLLQDGKLVMKDGKPVYQDCTVRLWDLEFRRPLGVVGGCPTPIMPALLFSSDGSQFFFGDGDKRIRHRDLFGPAPRELEELRDQRALVPAALSPDGQRLASSRYPGTVAVWDAKTGTKVHEWNFPETVTSVTAAADGRHLALGFATGVVYFVRLEGSTGR